MDLYNNVKKIVSSSNRGTSIKPLNQFMIINFPFIREKTREHKVTSRLDIVTTKGERLFKVYFVEF